MGMDNLRDKLQGEIRSSKEEADSLKKDLVVKDKIYQELKAKYELSEKQIAEKKNLAAQLEQQKRQVMEQVIKYKKLEKEIKRLFGYLPVDIHQTITSKGLTMEIFLHHDKFVTRTCRAHQT